MKQLEPLKNIQVWRFSMYYFCVFGAFVALALWLPRYLVGAYGFDIKTAGMLAASYSIFASLFRALGGWLSDRYGARLIMYWTFIVAAVCTFFLSYPPTDYVVHGIKGDISFSLAIGPVGFIFLMSVLGLFRDICAVTLSRFTGEKQPDISSQNIFLHDSPMQYLRILGAGYRKKYIEACF